MRIGAVGLVPLTLMLALCCFTSVALAAAAQEAHPLVELETGPCVAVSPDEVRRIVAIELGSLLAEPSQPPVDRTRVRVGCDADLAEVRVDDPITGKTLSRTIDLGQVAVGARSRLLALAIAELVVASWTELVVNPAPAALPAGPPASAQARRAALASVEKRKPHLPQRRLRLLAVASNLTFFSGSSLLWGGGVRLGQDLPRHLGWSADALAHHGASVVSLGSVTIDTISFGGALSFHWDWARLGLRTGAGIRGGAARLAGDPGAPQAVRATAGWGFWCGPLATLGFSITAAPHVLVELAGETGYAAVSVQGLVAGRSEVAVQGPWLSVSFGVGFY